MRQKASLLSRLSAWVPVDAQYSLGDLNSRLVAKCLALKAGCFFSCSTSSPESFTSLMNGGNGIRKAPTFTGFVPDIFWLAFETPSGFPHLSCSLPDLCPLPSRSGQWGAQQDGAQEGRRCKVRVGVCLPDLVSRTRSSSSAGPGPDTSPVYLPSCTYPPESPVLP